MVIFFISIQKVFSLLSGLTNFFDNSWDSFKPIVLKFSIFFCRIAQGLNPELFIKAITYLVVIFAKSDDPLLNKPDGSGHGV